MRVAALMTAKGTNTLANKNLLPVSGHPLIWYPASVAQRCPSINDLYVSSDSQEILNVCADLGYEKIVRPDYLALPASLHVDAITHALDYMRTENKPMPDVLIVLLGNTVFMKVSWLTEAVNRLANNPMLSCVTPVYQEQDTHPFRARKLDENGCLVPYFDFNGEKISTNRQDLPKNYFFSHNFWAIRLNNGKLPEEGHQPWTFMGNNVSPLVIDEGFDVHTREDLIKCEHWLEQNNVFE